MKEVWMLKIFLVWSFWTGVLTDAPTKFLFTAPRNLWQNSEEEFCISFHDDEPVNADYNVTLSSEDKNFRQVLGKGTATVEGRVCHKFTVPDTTGRLKLTLVTDTKRTVGNVITSVYREDNTEVEVHASSLETFVQTDKPMYKPGETVKFRTMTLNKDLKPWTGVVPLVTVKNPADVRVMQWKNVDNVKGLLSFEMSLSEDPPLGVWKITILVEGKEHEQTFTVQEYVLPKFEVSITAPKYLLPMSETIKGTVCAKYTYGKPVKGTVELTVCYKDFSPYFYYDGYQNRPCARRIMDINGCQTYTVDGSELYLDSSNYSRYGNLEINATVTEEATGVKLNGTMKGPEMTFEALKLKFEDDTRNYFKEAFPYYARVIVTKPDGSPAPGEIIEVAADNYNPDFHLKRNFTSDENGIVRFAIKKLPTDVNRLSFRARAPKYHEPFIISYYYVVKIYEPNAYHQARKWYSPSNSYIHIPSVEGQIDCGSTLDIDVLYSTTPDRDYKFFVQVLSKSHMVHHSHVRHHFLIHDAVNFDDIPNEMLLDPYTPPPTARWYYPYVYDKSDDPELAQKPEAVNVTVTVDNNDEKKDKDDDDDDVNDKKDDDDDTDDKSKSRDKRETTTPCNVLEVSKCMQPLSTIDPNSMDKVCDIYKTFETCFEPYRSSCEDHEMFQNIKAGIDTYKSMCKQDGCNVFAAAKCLNPMTTPSETQSSLADICKKYKEFSACIKPYEKACEGNTMLSGVSNVHTAYGDMCGKEEDEEDEPVTCTKMYKAFLNTTVMSRRPVTASSTTQLSECIRVCNEDSRCRGVTYMTEDSQICQLLYEADYETVEEPGTDYYKRNCFSEGRKQVEQSTHVAKVKISIPVTANMGPEAQLLVYYVRDDEETVAATLTFKVNKCFDNKVEMKFDQNTVYPGNDVSFNLKASPGSLCSVGVVDKSINLIGGDHQITPEKIFEQFKMPYMYTSYWKEDKKYCDKKTKFDPSMTSYRSYWGYGYRSYVTDAVDSVTAFRDMNLVVFTDLTLETRPCKVDEHPRIMYNVYSGKRPTPMMGAPGLAGSTMNEPVPVTELLNENLPLKPKQDVRTEFPETWLWNLYSIGIAQQFLPTTNVGSCFFIMRSCAIEYRDHGPIPGPMGPMGFGVNRHGPVGALGPIEITTTFQPVRTSTSTSTIAKKSSQKQIGLRKDFAEAWLWHLYLLGDEGEINVTSKIPHTITEWVGNSLCTNLDVGVGVSPMTGITAFQPFFLSFTLPYSAVRGEIVPVLVSIFNYMTECLVMQVSLPPSSDFGIEGDTTKSSHTSCVCPGETRTIKYHVIPYTLGKIKILATAESIPDDGTCGNNAVSMDGVGANDAVQMELLIEAEGIEKEYTITSYICPEGKTSEEEMVLPLPSDTDLVDDSARGYISVIGDIMGPALSNLKDLLQMPYGCGEQNMASFSPNIFALQYLTNTNQLLPKIEEEALGYMRIGYQRQLKYRHGDGSYSAWGGEGSGSIWLTSFVIKCLGQSRPYIDIDDKDLTKSISWFKSRQLENGCFPQIGYTHSYYLKGGFSDRSNDASLTAFVLIAMLESGINSSDPSVIKAVGCLDVQDIPDTYTMSLMAYAYTLYDLTHARRQVVMKMLEERAVNKDGLKFWTRTEKNETKEKNSWYYTAVSAEVEMTAYVLLSFITGEQQNAAINARPIVMWLTKQRNPRGGFSSTQDTIVALQALARYATLVYQGGVNVSVDVIDKTKGSIGTFNIDDDNTLVLQSKRITNLPTTLNAVVDGVGCAMVQANVKYNVYETPKSPTFDMSVNVYRAKDQVNHCGMRTLSICVRFTGPGGVSNMAIVDVKMVTGWIPVKESLEKLLVSKNSPNFIGIEKYEVDGSYVHIYFDQLDSTRRCFLVDVEQNIEISAPKPAQVKVYDYYEVDFTLIVNYEIKTTCGTKEELPYVSAQEYYSGLMVDIPIDEIVQVRIPPRFEFGGLPPVQSPKSCPVCMTTVDIKSDSFKAMVCGSQKIYKVEKGRKGDYPLKVFVNLRQQKKETINVFAKLKYDQRCTCDLIGGKLGKILVFSERDTFNDKEQILEFNVSTKVIKSSGALEKEIYRHVKKANCK